MYVMWNRTLQIGIPRVDKEHQYLVTLFNAFYTIYKQGATQDKIFKALNLLAKYADIHFRNEEELMEAGGYPELDDHRREHEMLTKQIFDLYCKCRQGCEEVSEKTFEFIKNWLLEHILGMDKKLETYFLYKGIPKGWEH